MVIPNKEPSYAHFFHVFSHTEIKNILVTGDAEIGYIGFGEKGMIWEIITLIQPLILQTCSLRLELDSI